MLKLNLKKSGFSTLSAFLVAITASTSLLPFSAVSAQPFPTTNPTATDNYRVRIPQGTLIPVTYTQSQQIRVNQGEYLPLELQVSANLRDSNGSLLIPAGTRIMGQLEPTEQGTRFVAREMIINNQWIPLNATSQVISRTETVNNGATVGNILSGTFSGAGAATIIAGTTGDRRIDALEVLGGAALGTLLGWGLPEGQIIGGGEHQEVVIDPNRDLTLTLNSDLSLIANQQNFPYRRAFNVRR
ncbi:conserved hypothetical protein [Crocosphaera subtropica ATCC 51142]|uniref:Uncharacterized protein n=1 Tax=Crocosphaera subtropica (strain ATCC 51142 / BH68) TaxID=43989 RepID=B1WNN9_CROS5|nr:hypothetical protein [Crocosphaera subtropica]ACB51468.1 conserved hypothetical protein [Crocosphaera subtropica ATCC 51142]